MGRKKGKNKDGGENGEGTQGTLGERQPVNAHLFTGYRDVRLPLGERGMLDVMHDQSEICKEIREVEVMIGGKNEQITEAEETLSVRRREMRDLEELKDTHQQRLRDSVEAHSQGFRVTRLLVEEVFLNGEVITYRKGTKDELCRRNATAEEWDAAQSIKDGAGRVVNRFVKGTPIPGKPNLVLIDGGKEVEPCDDEGHVYVGPTEDPTKPKKAEPAKKKRGRPPSKERPLPISATDANDDDDGEFVFGDCPGPGDEA